MQPLGRDGFDDKIKRPRAHGGNHRVDAALRCLHDDRGLRAPLAQLGKNGHAVNVRHHQVEDDCADFGRLRTVKRRKRRRAAVNRPRLKTHPRHRRFQKPALDRFVINNENAGRHFSPYGVSGLPLACHTELKNGSTKQVNLQLTQIARRVRPAAGIDGRRPEAG
jgi:hypothetical protein